MSLFVVVHSRMPGLAVEDPSRTPAPTSLEALTPGEGGLRVMTSRWSSRPTDRHDIDATSGAAVVTERPGWHIVSIETCFDTLDPDPEEAERHRHPRPAASAPALEADWPAGAERPDALHAEVVRLLRLERIRQLRGLVGVALSLALASVALALSEPGPTPPVAPAPVTSAATPGTLAIADEPGLPGPASQ